MNNLQLEELFRQADTDIKNGKYEAAVKVLEQIIEANPRFGKAYNHLGWMHETKFRNLRVAEKYYR